MKRLSAIFVLAAFLFGCSPERMDVPLEPLAVDLTKLKGLTVNFLYPPNSANDYTNCTVNEFELPGQIAFIKGTEGGLSYKPITKFKTAFTIGSELKTSFFAKTNPNTSTAILVVDDFGPTSSPVYALGDGLFKQTTLDLATIKQLQDSNQLSHGALVFRQIRDEILGTGLYTLNSALSTTTKKIYESKISTKFRLTVVAVNTELQSTGVIASRIKSAIDALALAPSPTPLTGIAINMSFALMPCEVYNDYKAWDSSITDVQTFEDYMKELFNKNTDVASSYDELVQAIVESTNNFNGIQDPLYRLIQGNSGVNYSARRNAYIASAGNYSLKYSMYPANWANVVNVTGSAVGTPSTRADFFNQGEVMHTAASFQLNPGSFCSPNCNPVYYLGTSFSAPTVTTFSALDLATVKRCKNPTLNSMPFFELAKDTFSLVDRPLETIGATPGAVSVRCGVN
jgi:hypothetical protein